MTDDNTFSTYDAKARFSELLRRVRSGSTITVTYHGEPVAEIRPVDRSSGTAARLEWLRSRGEVLGPERRDPGERDFSPVTSCPGALERFLAERDEQ